MFHQKIVVLNNQDGVNSSDGFTCKMRTPFNNIKRVELCAVRVSAFNTLVTTEQYVFVDVQPFSAASGDENVDASFVVPVLLDSNNQLVYNEKANFRQTKVIETENYSTQSFKVRFFTGAGLLDVSAKYVTVMLRITYEN